MENQDGSNALIFNKKIKNKKLLNLISITFLL